MNDCGDLASSMRKICSWFRQRKRIKLPPLTDQQLNEVFDKAWDDLEVAGIRTPYGDTQKEYFRGQMMPQLKEMNNDDDR